VREAAGHATNGSALGALEHAQVDRDVYLVLDQAEEYFLYHADDGGPSSFAETLPALLGAQVRVNALISLREDSLAKLDRFTGRIPGLFSNTLRLDRLDRQSARSAIVKPVARYAELAGVPVSVEPELVDHVLDEVGAGRIEPALGGLGAVEGSDSGARIEAPYLQLVLQRIWDEDRAMGSTVLRADTLARLGGAQHVVEEHLAGALDELSEDQKDVAAHLFNHLVTPSGTKIAHDVADLADFGNASVTEVQPVLSQLADRRILRSVEEGGHVRYEIFHDVLAQPVLAWRTRWRTEREIERQVAEEARRRSRTQRLLALGLGLLGLVVAILVFAVVQQRHADEQERVAQARKLDASAIALLTEDPELSLLLARESGRLAPGPSAEDALLQSLLSSRVRASYRVGEPVPDIAFGARPPTVALVDARGRLVEILVGTGRSHVLRKVGRGGEVALSGDGSYVVVRGRVGPPRIVDRKSGRVRCELRGVGGAAADAVPAGSFVVTVRNGVGAISNASNCRLVRTIGRVGSTAVTIVVSPDGRRAAFVSGRESRIADLPSGKVRRRLRHPGAITSLAFSADGRRVVTGGRDGLARIWSSSGRLLRELKGHGGQILDVAFSPLGTEVATASTDGTARVWNAATGELEAPLFGHTDFVRTVDFSPDGLSVVTASDDGTARSWALTGRRLATFAGHSARVLDARFMAEGRLVATVSEDGTVRVWDTGVAPDLTRTSLAPPPRPETIATQPGGDVVAKADGSAIRLVRAHGPSSTLAGHRLKVTSVAFSPDGTRLVSASRDSDVILWDVATGHALRRLRGHFGAVSDARFSPDGRWIVTAGPRTVGLWRASDGRLIRLLSGPEGPFLAAGFAPDSRTIVARSKGGVTTSYDCRICAGIPELLVLADERLAATGRELTPEERELYLG
jgi:WD40 repeat protein